MRLSAVNHRTSPPWDELRAPAASGRSAPPPPTPQPPPVAAPTPRRELEEQLEDGDRYVAQDGRDAGTTEEFPAEVPAAGPPPRPPPPPSATAALHHRPSGHPAYEQEATHSSAPTDPGRTEGNEKIVEDPPEDVRARKEQAGTEQPEGSAGTPGHGVVMQRVRGEGDQDRTEPEELKDNRRARSAGRGRARYRADAAAAAERRVLLGGGRRCRGAGRSDAGVPVVAAVGGLAVRRRFRFARPRARTCRTRWRMHWGLAHGRRRGNKFLDLALFPWVACGAEIRGILGALLKAALVVTDAVQRPRGLLAGLGDVRISAKKSGLAGVLCGVCGGTIARKEVGATLLHGLAKGSAGP